MRKAYKAFHLDDIDIPKVLKKNGEFLKLYYDFYLYEILFHNFRYLQQVLPSELFLS